jgi:hypothetical protein
MHVSMYSCHLEDVELPFLRETCILLVSLEVTVVPLEHPTGDSGAPMAPLAHPFPCLHPSRRRCPLVCVRRRQLASVAKNRLVVASFSPFSLSAPTLVLHCLFPLITGNFGWPNPVVLDCWRADLAPPRPRFAALALGWYVTLPLPSSPLRSLWQGGVAWGG